MTDTMLVETLDRVHHEKALLQKQIEQFERETVELNTQLKKANESNLSLTSQVHDVEKNLQLQLNLRSNDAAKHAQGFEKLRQKLTARDQEYQQLLHSNKALHADNQTHLQKIFNINLRLSQVESKNDTQSLTITKLEAANQTLLSQLSKVEHLLVQSQHQLQISNKKIDIYNSCQNEQIQELTATILKKINQNELSAAQLHHKDAEVEQLRQEYYKLQQQLQDYQHKLTDYQVLISQQDSKIKAKDLELSKNVVELGTLKQELIKVQCQHLELNHVQKEITPQHSNIIQLKNEHKLKTQIKELELKCKASEARVKYQTSVERAFMSGLNDEKMTQFLEQMKRELQEMQADHQDLARENETFKQKNELYVQQLKIIYGQLSQDTLRQLQNSSQPMSFTEELSEINLKYQSELESKCCQVSELQRQLQQAIDLNTKSDRKFNHEYTQLQASKDSEIQKQNQVNKNLEQQLAQKSTEIDQLRSALNELKQINSQLNTQLQNIEFNQQPQHDLQIQNNLQQLNADQLNQILSLKEQLNNEKLSVMQLNFKQSNQEVEIMNLTNLIKQSKQVEDNLRQKVDQMGIQKLAAHKCEDVAKDAIVKICEQNKNELEQRDNFISSLQHTITELKLLYDTTLINHKLESQQVNDKQVIQENAQQEATNKLLQDKNALQQQVLELQAEIEIMNEKDKQWPATQEPQLVTLQTQVFDLEQQLGFITRQHKELQVDSKQKESSLQQENSILKRQVDELNVQNASRTMFNNISITDDKFGSQKLRDEIYNLTYANKNLKDELEMAKFDASKAKRDLEFERQNSSHLFKIQQLTTQLTAMESVNTQNQLELSKVKSDLQLKLQLISQLQAELRRAQLEHEKLIEIEKKNRNIFNLHKAEMTKTKTELESTKDELKNYEIRQKEVELKLIKDLERAKEEVMEVEARNASQVSTVEVDELKREIDDLKQALQLLQEQKERKDAPQNQNQMFSSMLNGLQRAKIVIEKLYNQSPEAIQLQKRRRLQ